MSLALPIIREGVSSSPWSMSDALIGASSPEGRWLAWGRSAFALTVVVVLLALGVANIATWGQWHELEDGVLWGSRANAVTALEVAPGSPAARAGIRPGDVLL